MKLHSPGSVGAGPLAILAAAMLFLAPAPGAAQAASFTAVVQPATIPVGEQFEYILTLAGSDVGGAAAPKPPDFGSFVLISGPNQSTSMQWINGRSSASVTYTYILYARQPGTLALGPATIVFKGTTLRTDAVKIDVTKGKAPQASPTSPQQSIGARVGDNLVLRAIPDRQRVRRGEQVTVTYELFNNIEISQVRQKKDPAVEGFWIEEISNATQLNYKNETLNGKRYRVAVLRKIALFPTQAGSLTVGPYEITCGVLVRRQQKSNDPFDSFFSDPFFQQMQTVDYDLKSNPLTITVDPLPAAPEGFSGAVGRFGLSSSIDRTSVRAGEPVTLKLVVAGAGNVKLLTMPKLSLPGDIEAYEPKTAEEVTRDDGVLRGKKTAEYLLVPRNAGQRVIDAVTFVYFDIDRNTYVTLRTPRFDLTVEPGKEIGASGTIAAKEDVRLLGEDIRFLRLDIGRVQRTDEGDSWWMVTAGLVLPPLVYIGAFRYRRRQDRIRGNLPRMLFQRAGREAGKRLKRARGLLQENDSAAYHSEVLRALTQYLEHKLRITPAEFTFDGAADRLRGGGVPDDVLQRLQTCIERAEYIRYAPTSDSAGARKELLDAATAGIEGVERTFRGRRGS